MKEYVLFDLDGTLTDPKVGITTCVQYALKEFGIEEPDLDKLEPFIGPPLKNSFMEFYQMTSEEADRAIAKYRERFSEIGLFENEVYAGIPAILEGLQDCGMVLGIASSKPTEFVERILEHFDLWKYFRVVVGSELDGTRVEKEDVMMDALRELFHYKPIQYAKVYMVGDRKFDVEASKNIGVECIGVSYGYGSRDELKEAGADYIADSVEELSAILLDAGQELRQSLIQKLQAEAPQPQAAKTQSQAVQSKPQTAQQKSQTNGKQQKNLFQVVKPFIFPFLLFVLVKFVSQNILLFMIGIGTKDISGPLAKMIFLYDEAGNRVSLNGTLSDIITALTYVIGAALVYKIAKSAIEKTKEEEKSKHQKPEKPLSYILFALITISVSLGLHVIMELSGLTTRTEDYRVLVQNGQTSNIIVGIICVGIVIPVVEELIFRGMLFNLVKRHYIMWQAILLSSFLYGFYQVDSSKGMYGMVLGCIAAYAYEYYGHFAAPVLVQVTSGVITYLLTGTELVHSGIFSSTIGVVCMVIVVFGVHILLREKNFLKEKKEV